MKAYQKLIDLVTEPEAKDTFSKLIAEAGEYAEGVIGRLNVRNAKVGEKRVKLYGATKTGKLRFEVRKNVIDLYRLLYALGVFASEQGHWKRGVVEFGHTSRYLAHELGIDPSKMKKYYEILEAAHLIKRRVAKQTHRGEAREGLTPGNVYNYGTVFAVALVPWNAKKLIRSYKMRHDYNEKTIYRKLLEQKAMGLTAWNFITGIYVSDADKAENPHIGGNTLLRLLAAHTAHLGLFLKQDLVDAIKWAGQLNIGKAFDWLEAKWGSRIAELAWGWLKRSENDHLARRKFWQSVYASGGQGDKFLRALSA